MNTTHTVDFDRSAGNVSQCRSAFHSPAFVVGKERSGTTLVSAILNRHSEICVTPETNFLYRLFRYPGGPECFEREWPDSLYKIVDSMKPTADWNKPAHLVYERVGGQVVTGREAFIALGETISEHYGKSLWIEKTPNHILCLPFIRFLFPEAPIIIIVRDGRDVAHSLTKVRFGSSNFYENLWLWRQANSGGRTFAENDNNTLAIRYEDLVQNPGTIVRQICLFLGVPFDDRMLVPDGTEKTLLDTTGSHMNQAAMSVDKSKVAAWRNNVLPDKLRVSEMIAQDELRAWGYDLITTSTIPSLVLRTSELMLVSRQHRDLYDTILQAIANGSHSVRLENVGSLLDPVCGSMPDLWVTEEVPLPHPSSTSKVTSIVFIMRVVLLLLRLKFANAKLVWVFQPFPELSRKWWLRRMVEKVMVKMSTVTVLNCEKRISLAELKKYYGSGIDKCLRADDPNFTQMLLKRISLWSSSASDVAQQDAEQE